MNGSININEPISGELKIGGTLTGTIQIGGGAAPVLDSVTVKSTTQSQTVVPQEGVDGFNEITVSPLLLQSKSVTPGSAAIVVTPDNGYDALSSVNVAAAAGGDCVLDFSVSFNAPIPESMFMDMKNLTGVTFKVNSSNLSIGKWAFRGCTNLKRVEIPVCTGIGVNAFQSVTGHDLYIGASTPFGFDVIPIDSAYDVGEPAAIHCPPELVNTYKADAKWGVWSSIIVGDYNWPY